MFLHFTFFCFFWFVSISVCLGNLGGFGLGNLALALRLMIRLVSVLCVRGFMLGVGMLIDFTLGDSRVD